MTRFTHVCEYVNFAYMQICPCERKAKFADVGIDKFVQYQKGIDSNCNYF